MDNDDNRQGGCLLPPRCAVRRATANIEVRASAALGCRRALWYSATGISADESAQRRLADGDGVGKRP